MRYRVSQETISRTHWRSALARFPVCRPFAIHLFGGGMTLTPGQVGHTHISFAQLGDDKTWINIGWEAYASRALSWSDFGPVPCGSIDKPFQDVSQAWEVMCFRHEGVVYACEGGGDNEASPSNPAPDILWGDIDNYLQVDVQEFDHVLEKFLHERANGLLKRLQPGEEAWVSQ